MHKNSVMERLKNEINKKYSNRSNDPGNNSKIGDSLLSSAVPGGITMNNQNTGNNSNKQSNTHVTNPKLKQKQAITKLKLLHNELEHNYVLLLKNLSKKIIKPKDLVSRKYDTEYLSNKIK